MTTTVDLFRSELVRDGTACGVIGDPVRLSYKDRETLRIYGAWRDPIKSHPMRLLLYLPFVYEAAYEHLIEHGRYNGDLEVIYEAVCSLGYADAGQVLKMCIGRINLDSFFNLIYKQDEWDYSYKELLDYSLKKIIT